MSAARNAGERRGESNDIVLLTAIRQSAEGISRVELAELTGLSPQGVSKIVRRLLDAGLVVVSGTAATARGKPRTVLTLNAESRFAIGIHLDPSAITLVALDLAGAIVGEASIPMSEIPSPESAVAEILSSVAELVEVTQLPRERVLGLGVASPGPIDHERGVIIGPVQLRGWESVPLRDALQQATGYDVTIDNDATSSALAELWSGDHVEHHSFGSVHLGTGVGFGLVLNNEIVRGSFNNLGEIAHLYSGMDDIHHWCGRRGCIGPLVDPRQIVARATEGGVLKHPDSDVEPVRLHQLYDKLAELARGGEPRASAIIDDVGQGLQRVVVDIANLLDLDRIVLGGPFWEPISSTILDRMQDVVQGGFTAGALHQVEVVSSTMGAQVGAIGAASLVLDRFFGSGARGLALHRSPLPPAAPAHAAPDH